jgi:hypothetical protein
VAEGDPALPPPPNAAATAERRKHGIAARKMNGDRKGELESLSFPFLSFPGFLVS